MWEKLGVQAVIDEATSIDRAGAVALEHIICTKGQWDPLGGVGLPEIILTGAWYICWERRHIIQGEEVQTTQRSALSIGALATNYWRDPRRILLSENWKPRFAQVKVS
jgi:hypothetical protein